MQLHTAQPETDAVNRAPGTDTRSLFSPSPSVTPPPPHPRPSNPASCTSSQSARSWRTLSRPGSGGRRCRWRYVLVASCTGRLYLPLSASSPGPVSRPSLPGLLSHPVMHSTALRVRMGRKILIRSGVPMVPVIGVRCSVLMPSGNNNIKGHSLYSPDAQ